MCIGKCARFTGLCLIFLALLSAAVNLFLLFPNFDGSYLQNNEIGIHAKSVPGVWAGGFMVLLAGVYTTMVGFRAKSLSCTETCCKMLWSGMFSILAMIGAAMSLFISAVGLLSGPYCMYFMEGEAASEWGYPYITNIRPVSNTSLVISLPDISWKKTCIKPPNIETWNSNLFISLCLINTLQIILCLFQLVNSFFGMIVGHCDQKKLFAKSIRNKTNVKGPSQRKSNLTDTDY
ncbi:transmembrane 4 L6 family member 19 [Gastrophryne carolinensis]